MTHANEHVNVYGKVIVEIHDALTGKLKSRDVISNLVVDSGRAAIADALRGNLQNGRGVITFAAVGTGSASPTAGDVKLQTEIARKQVSIRSSSGKTASFKTFFNQTEANGVLREIGLFGDSADAVVDSGTLYARLNISRTKTSNDTLTITHGITID